MVVTPPTVMETSLTMVLAELPPPDPALPPADCEDDVSDVADAADVDEAADVEDVDVVAADGDAVTVALAEAIALIDMKTSPEGNTGRSAGCAPSPSTRRACQAGAGSAPSPGMPGGSKSGGK